MFKSCYTMWDGDSTWSRKGEEVLSGYENDKSCQYIESYITFPISSRERNVKYWYISSFSLLAEGACRNGSNALVDCRCAQFDLTLEKFSLE